MAEEAKKDGLVSLLNKGKRHFDVIGANGKPFRHSPEQIGVYTEAQAKDLEGYSDLKDISKLPGVKDHAKLKSDNAALEKENAALLAEKKKLEEQVAALSAAPAAASEAPAASSKKSKQAA